MGSHQNEFFCDVCQVSLNSETQFESHMIGQRHLRAVRSETLLFGPDIIVISKNEYRCSVCEVSLNGTVPVVEHLNGIVHFNKKEHQNNKIIFDDNIVIDNNKYFCKVCNISCCGDIPMQNHIKGVLHAKKNRRLRM